MAWRAARTSGLLAIAVAAAIALAAAPAARAQEPPVTLPTEALTETMPPDLPPRPRFSLAVGMGATLDSTGFSDGAHLIPAFFGVGGFGDGIVGFDLGAFSSSASGRYAALGRRPGAGRSAGARCFRRRSPRGPRSPRRPALRLPRAAHAGGRAGAGLERDGRSMVSGSRFEVHTGARVELPLTPAGLPSELRLRLAVRRAIGLYTPEVAVAQGSTPATAVGDSTELYAALAVIF